MDEDTVCEVVMEGQEVLDIETLSLWVIVLDTVEHTVGESEPVAVED